MVWLSLNYHVKIHLPVTFFGLAIFAHEVDNAGECLIQYLQDDGFAIITRMNM